MFVRAHREKTRSSCRRMPAFNWLIENRKQTAWEGKKTGDNKRKGKQPDTYFNIVRLNIGQVLLCSPPTIIISWHAFFTHNILNGPTREPNSSMVRRNPKYNSSEIMKMYPLIFHKKIKTRHGCIMTVVRRIFHPSFSHSVNITYLLVFFFFFQRCK